MLFLQNRYIVKQSCLTFIPQIYKQRKNQYSLKAIVVINNAT